MKIWYMRDNHTFRPLSADPKTAKDQIAEEFECGYTWGMLCTKEVHIEPEHARGKLAPFLAKVDKWYKKISDLSIGVGI